MFKKIGGDMLIEISLSFFYPVFVVIAKKHSKLFNLFAFTVGLSIFFFLNFEYSSNLKWKSTFECKTLHSNFRCPSGSLAKKSLHFNAFFFCLSSWCGAAHSKYCGKQEHQCGEDVVYLKTETKPFTQNAYLFHFLEGHLSSLHSRLTQESPKPCKMNVSST